MKIDSKVLIKGSYFSTIYKGEIIREELTEKPIWVVLVEIPVLGGVKSVESSYFKDSLECVSSVGSNFYIEEEENEQIIN